MQNVDCTAAHISINDTFNEVCMVKLIKADFDGHVMQFNDAGWFNATIAADAFGKRPGDWLDQDGTKEYIAEMSRALNTSQDGILETRKGRNGGTWLHPKLAVAFSRWLSVQFAVWCDLQIDHIIRGERKSIDWDMERHISKATNKLQAQSVQEHRKDKGKETLAHHYTNEAKLINFALIGEYRSIDRDSLSADDLNLIAKLETTNSMMILKGLDRDERRDRLCDMVATSRAKLLGNGSAS